MTTNIFHIAYCPEIKEASLHYWGCNFACRGCSCKKIIWDWMIKEFLSARDDEPKGTAEPPKRFLEFEQVMRILEKLELKRVLHMGQEAVLDPEYARLTSAIHQNFGAKNVLLTNAYEMPPLEHTDKVELGIKGITDSLHIDYTGKSNTRVLANFVKIYQSGVEMIVESPFIPGYMDLDETEKIAKFISSVDKDILYVILPYFKAGDNPWRRPTHAEIDQAVGMAREHLNKVYFAYGDEELKYEVINIFPNDIRARTSQKQLIPSYPLPALVQWKERILVPQA